MPTTVPDAADDFGQLKLSDLSITAATGYTAVEAAKVDTASHVLIEACMTARGFSYSFTPPSSSDAAFEDERKLDVMLFDNIEALTRDGYDALLPSPDIVGGGDASVVVAADPDTQQALTSCQRESDQQLNPSGVQAGTNQVPGALEAEQTMNTAMFEALEPESELWSQCMARGGITGASINSIPAQVANGEATSINTALLDARCRTETGYTTRLVEFRTAAVKDFLTTNAAEVNQTRAPRTTEISNAEAVLAEQGIEVE